MKKIFTFIIIMLALVITPKAKAQNFFDTSEATNFFTLSARLGINTSNRTFPSGHYNLWNNNSWGTGFSAGVLANLNFRDYLSIQPGIFFQSRSGDFAYLTEYIDSYNQNQTHYEMGHLRNYNATVPIMAIVKFNLAPQIKWMVEFGPYFQYRFSETGQNNVSVLYRLPQSTEYGEYTAELKKYDVGLKVGSGLRFFGHYYVGFHYLAGFMDAWQLPIGGRNKCWEFSLGYDF